MYTIQTNLGEYKKEVYSFIKTEVKEKLLVAPTGTGKTYTIIQFAKEHPHLKLALLCPTQSLVKNIGEDYKDVPCGFGAEFLDYHRFSNFIVTTYDSIERLEDMDYIFIDEGHQMASDGSYRKVIAKILESEFKKVFISATPEIIEDYIPTRLDFKIHRPKQQVKIFSGNYNIKRTITDIISNNKGINKTVLIRINSKEVIEEIYESFKPTFKDKIARIYSDEKNVLYDNQNIDVIDNLKVGNISNVDVVLCTSIYDAGLSFKVDRDIQAYAVSNHTQMMPNPIDMVQFLARVRENTGYKMDLTIIGQYGDYSRVENNHLTSYKSMNQLTDAMANIYEGYRKLNFEDYLGLLEYYNIYATEVTSLGFKASKVKFANKVSNKDIADNFHNFPKEYAIITSNLDNDKQRYQIDLITGDKTISGGSSTKVQRVFNHLLYATENDIPFTCFNNQTYSIDNFNMLEMITENYGEDDIFSNLIDNIVYPTSSTLNYKELGYNELIQTEKKQVRRLFNMFYKSNDFRRAKAKFIEKDNTNEEVRKYLYTLATAPPTAPDYSF
jgi:hypothetical protein